MFDQLLNRKIGDYVLEIKLGEGGMASVYRARHEGDDRVVAVKIISDKLRVSPTFLKRFEREARVMASFDHPHILPVYDFGRSEGYTYLAMHLVEGGSLGDYIHSATLETQTALEFLEKIASALDYAHERGIVHRDLKPANVLLDANRNIFLTDFGIAKIKEESVSLTATDTVLGSPSYMAPEQWRAEPVDGRTDVYAFGVMMFELLTGRLPFHSDTPFSLMYRHLDEAPPAISKTSSQLPRSFDRIVRRAMAKIPDHRYDTAGAVMESLWEVWREAGESSAPPHDPHATIDHHEADPHATWDEKTYTPAALGNEKTVTPVDYPGENERTVTPVDARIPVSADEKTYTPADVDAYATDLADDDFEYDFLSYNAVDVGARSLLIRANEAVRELEQDKRILAQAVITYIQDLREQAKQKLDLSQGPYRALESYDISDNKLFFGREAAIEAMLARSPHARFAVLHAESGSGKTSLLRAGVMPRLLAGGFLPLYMAVRRRPPHQAIKSILLPDDSDAADLHGASLRTYLRGLAEVIGTNREIFIFIDQFETFFSDAFTDEQRAAFVSELADCLDDPFLPLRVTLAMRTEYFGLLASFQPHIPQPFAHEFLLRALTREEAKRALILPVRAQQYNYQTEAAEMILDDLADASHEIAPPHLQLVGGALIEMLPEDRKTITLEDYQQAGRAKGVLQGYLERLLARFPMQQRQLARLVIEGLVRADQTRDIRTRESLLDEFQSLDIATQALDSVLTALRENRILRVVELEDSLAYELVHDYLALQVQLDPETIARKAAQELLDRRLGDFERYGSLLTQQEYQIISTQSERLHLSDSARLLLARTRAARRRQRYIAGGLIAAAVLGVIGVLALGLYAAQRESQNRQERLELAQTSEAEIAAQRDVAQTNALLSESGQVALQGLLELNENRIDAALLLGVLSRHVYDTREARSTLLTVLQRIPQLNIILYEHENWVRDVAYSPDNDIFASADSRGQIIIWDAATHSPRGLPLAAHEGGIWSIAFSPDGQRLVSAGEDGNLIEWDITTAQPIGDPWAQTGENIYRVVYSHDGQLIASGHDDGIVRLWDADSKALIAELNEHTAPVMALDFSPDDTLIASGGQDNTVVLWVLGDDGTYTAQSHLSGHTNWVLDVAFSLDGNTLVSGSADSTLRLWDVETGSLLRQPITDHTDWVRSIAFSPDGSMMATGSRDRTIILRDAATGQRLSDVPPLIGHADEVHSITFSPDGAWLVSGGEEGHVLLWDVRQRIPLSSALTGHTNWVYDVDFSPDGSRLLSGSADGTALLWDVESEQINGEPFPAGGEVVSAAFSPDGDGIAYADAGGGVFVWELGASEPLITFNANSSGAVRRVAFSPDGQILATGGDDSFVKFWNPVNGEAIGEPLSGHTDWVTALAFSPDGQTLVSGGQDRMLILWDVNTREQIAVFPDIHTDGITDLAYSPDGSTLASASRDGTIILWDATSQEVIGQPLTGHTSWVLSIAFSPDGTMLASGGRDNVVLLWDIATRQPIGQPLAGHASWVWNVAFSPDGHTLASASRDATIRLWNVDPAAWEMLACRIANRELTEVEWFGILPRHTYEVVCTLS